MSSYLMYKCRQEILQQTYNSFRQIQFFYNDTIRTGNKTKYNKFCIKNGIKYIIDITKEDGNIYTHDFTITYNVSIFFFTRFI